MQIEDHLTQIRNRMATGARKVPARLLKDLIAQMGPTELSDWRPDIVRIVNDFTKKPRKSYWKFSTGAIRHIPTRAGARQE